MTVWSGFGHGTGGILGKWLILLEQVWMKRTRMFQIVSDCVRIEKPTLTILRRQVREALSGEAERVCQNSLPVGEQHGERAELRAEHGEEL